MRELGTNRYRERNEWHELSERTEAHLDPDLCGSARRRDAEWRPVFGQCDAAQTVLANRGVTRGDLFIFYGTFRKTGHSAERLEYNSKSFHAVFGYMSIGDIVRVDGSTRMPWCAEHPHLVNRNRKNNTLYVADDLLRLGGMKMAGAGNVPFSRRRVLSSSTERISRWRLPRFFHPALSGKTMSNHVADNWELTDEAAFLQTKSPGQEYVVEATDSMLIWVRELLGQNDA
jgi:hypothetical protein